MLKELHFGGCGGLYPYFIGVANYIQKNYNLDDVIFTGSSAGCFPALCMAMKKDIDLLYHEWNIPFLIEVSQTRLGPLYNWYDILRKHTYNYLPDNIDELKLNIWITKTPNILNPRGWKTELVRKWNVAASEFEFQRLHGMGHLLYDVVQQNTDLEFNIRIYAPVGAHKDLLPYLVRRLLENGANSSFVNRFMNKGIVVDKFIQDTVKLVEEKSPKRHTLIPLPVDILSYQNREVHPRKNAVGFELSDPIEIAKLNESFSEERQWKGGPIISGNMGLKNIEDVISPTTGKTIGQVAISTDLDIENALVAASHFQKKWNNLGGEARAEILDRAANKLEKKCLTLMRLIAEEAGRTLEDGLSEVREAVDFLRYYAGQARENFTKAKLLPGPTGERNALYL